MLSLFPSLLSWSELSPLLIRLTLGVIFVYWSYRAWRGVAVSSQQKLVSVVEGLVGILLIIGLWTQAAALIVIIDLIIHLAERAVKKAFLTDGVNYYLILLVLAVSLLVTGAGFLAFDYRL